MQQNKVITSKEQEASHNNMMVNLNQENVNLYRTIKNQRR